MTHLIAKATPRPDHTVEIEWTDGSRSVADIKPYIAKGGVLTPLGDPVFFVNTLKIDWQGYSLSWEGDIEFSAEGLWQDSHGAIAPSREVS